MPATFRAMGSAWQRSRRLLWNSLALAGVASKPADLRVLPEENVGPGKAVLMVNLTSQAMLYREAVRSLWNNLLRVGADYDRIDLFEAVSEQIFRESVLGAVGRKTFVKSERRDPYPFLVVKPSVDPLPINIRRPAGRNIYWDDPVTLLKADGLGLKFIAYYDYNQLEVIDLRYLRVRIDRCAEVPRVLGQDALVDVQTAELWYAPESE